VQIVEWSIDPGHTILTETENKQKRFNILPKIYDRNRKRQKHLKGKEIGNIAIAETTITAILGTHFPL